MTNDELIKELLKRGVKINLMPSPCGESYEFDVLIDDKVMYSDYITEFEMIPHETIMEHVRKKPGI